MTDQLRSAEELALAVWDTISPETADKVSLRQAAVDLLFASKATPRPPRIAAARDLAFCVIHWADIGTADGYQNVKRASWAYEELRLR
jgi:hypothetical protein